jgi:citrate synthase
VAPGWWKAHVTFADGTTMNGEARSRKYLTAAEAAARLGVHRSTLYAYVSRGHVRAEPDPRTTHASRYLAADVERLRDRKQARLHPGEAARKTLHLGLPVLQSAVTLIEDGRFFYRGQDALHLARTSSFEEVMTILWQSQAAMPVPRPRARAFPSLLRALMRPIAAADRLQVALPFASRADRRASDSSPRGLCATGWRIMDALVAAATMRDPPRTRCMAAHLARAWKARHERATAMLDAALILSADHELNVSAFAVRVAASAGSSLYDAVLAGLCTLRGTRHGGQTDLVEQLLDESGSPRGLRTEVERRLRSGVPVPGFGHPLYPDGDPRARALCEMVTDACPGSAAAGWARAIEQVGPDRVGELPTLDTGLVLLRRALHLPRGSAFLLFALGRSAGWMAHAMEQYASSQVIRPRALYSGQSPAL